MNKELLEQINSIPQTVDASAKYWFFRTNGGEYYETFIENRFVAIGYNDLTIPQIHLAHKAAKETFDAQPASADGKPRKSLAAFEDEFIAAMVKLRYEEETRPGYIGKQIADFVYSFKRGDIVIIPSESSQTVTIGRIEDDNVYIEPDEKLGGQICPFNKRRKVRWLKHVDRQKLDAKLFRVIYAHRTITQLDEDTASIIDRSLGTLYQKGEKTHFVLEFNKKDNIKAQELFTIWPELFTLVNSFCIDMDIPFDPNSIEAKVNVQSPGVIELIEPYMYSLTPVALFVYVIVGGKIKWSKDAGLEIGGGGIVGAADKILNLIIKWRDANNKQKTFDALYIKFKNNELDQDKTFDLMNSLLGTNDKSLKKPKALDDESDSN